MGNHIVHGPPSRVDIDSLLHDLPGITWEANLGKARFLKTLKVIHDEGTAVCKIYLKPSPSISLEKYADRLTEIRDSFTRFVKNPNVFPYTKFIETEKGGYMLRQYFHNNLYDRISTRPFLTSIEKTWITFQLLKAIERCHFYGICHGDLKCENVMVTSWNWIYLTDFALYKPTYLPEDNPADYSYFFDSSGRRLCYIAPERFYGASRGQSASGQPNGAGATPSAAPLVQPSTVQDIGELETTMDIFSLGCIIAELWLEGTPLFNLSELLSYRKVDDLTRYDPMTKINKIENEHVRRLIASMISLVPSERLSAMQYIKSWTPDLFPAYFGDLHAYMAAMMELEPDNRVKIISQDFELLLSKFTAGTLGKGPKVTEKRSTTSVSTAEMIKRLMEDPIIDDPTTKENAKKKASSPAMPFLSNPLVLDKHVEEGMIETQRFIHDLEIEAKSPAAQTSDEFTKALDELSAESANLTIVDDPSQPIKKLHIAEGHYKKALQDAKQKQDKVGMIAAYESLGKVTAGAGDFDKAIKYINKQLALAKELDHTESQQKGMFQLGLTAAELGEPEKAVSSFEEALDIAQKRDDRVSQVRILQKLSESYLLTKQFDKAASAQQDYIQMSREIGVKLLGGTRPIQAPQLDNAHYSFTSPATGLHTPSSLAASTAPNSSPVVNGFVMVVSVLCSMLRNLREPQAKLTCLDTFNRVAPYVDDEVRLQRLVPFAVSLLAADSRDQSALVRAQAIKTLANIMSLVRTFPASDAHIFPEYLLPILNSVNDAESEELVLQAYAESLPKLADTARRFLEMSQFFKTKQTLKDSSGPPDAKSPGQPSFQKEFDEIRNTFKDTVVSMLRDDAPAVVKKAILSGIASLCVFFGQEQTNDVLLPLIFSTFNSKDWELKCIVFENIVGVSTVASADSVESWILTCIPSQIHDEVEFVVAGAVNCLASLCDLGIFKKQRLIEIVEKCAPLLLHPNTWIRFGAASIMLSVARKLSTADTRCFLIPKLRKFLLRDIAEVTKATLLQSLSPPVSRKSFEKALSCSYDMSASMGSTHQSDDALDELGDGSRGDEIDIPFSLAIAELDVPPEDERKLLAMKEFIKLTALKRATRARTGLDNVFSDAYRLLSQKAPVHELPVSAGIPALPIEDAPEQNEEWKDFFGTHTPSQSSSSKQFSAVTQELLGGSAENAPGGPTTPKKGRPRKPSIAPLPAGLSGVNSPSGSPSLRNILPGSPVPPAAGAPAANAASASSLPANLTMMNVPNPLPDIGALYRLPFTGASLKSWRPSGVLVAHLHEHAAPINEVQVSADNLFFTSCSDDGTVKIWDCQRLEKNVTNRSRLTYSSQGGKITSTAILESSHSIAAASSNGSIHIFRIEHAKKEKSSLFDYNGLTTVKQLDKLEGAVVKVEHFDKQAHNQSLVLYATDAGIVHAWDLRSSREPWSFQNKPHLGMISTILVDPSRNWVAIGTNRGFVTCWDLRFKVCFREWRLPDQSVVHQFANLATTGPTSWSGESTTSLLAAAGPGDLAEWNIQTAQCKRMFRILSRPTPIPSTQALTDVAMVQDDMGISDLKNPPRSETRVRSLALPPQLTGATTHIAAPSTAASNSSAQGSAALQQQGYNFLFTAGTDKKIRYWDLANPRNSYVLCGLEKDEPRPVYSSRNVDGVEVIEELPGAAVDAVRAYDDPAYREPNLDPPPMAHRDTILSLNIIESPSRMLVSASRDGAIKVWK